MSEREKGVYTVLCKLFILPRYSFGSIKLQLPVEGINPHSLLYFSLSAVEAHQQDHTPLW